MNRFLLPALAAALSFVASASAQFGIPVVEKSIGDVSVPLGTKTKVVKFKDVFAIQGVTGPTVRFTTGVGNIDVALLSDVAPKTVATFLNYAKAGGNNPAGDYTYADTLIQRAVPDFVVQGGGFFVDDKDQINQILNRPSIPGEPGVLNTRGTLAMALSAGPDSGTGDFFFNVAANTNLDDASNGGPFTVFGKVINGLDVLDAIEALPQRDFGNSLGESFRTVPLVNYDGASDITVANLLRLKSVVPIPIIAPTAGVPALLKLKLKSNSNPDLVRSAVFNGKKLTLTFNAGVTGTSTITVFAKDSAKNKATTQFTVTVE